MRYINFQKGQFKIIIAIIITVFSVGCKSKTTKEKNVEDIITETPSVKFTYQDITGIGKDSLYNRRDNSDIIKVDGTYYVWYSRMDSLLHRGIGLLFGMQHLKMKAILGKSKAWLLV